MRPRLPLLLMVSILLAACAGVLGVRRAPSHPFEHRAHVSKGINCLTCHTGVMSSEDDGRLHLPSTEDCVKCHKKPHDSRTCGNSPRRRLRAGFCGHGAQASAVRSPNAHARGKGRLRALPRRDWAERPETIRPKMASCFGCHQHENQWAVRDCDGCHVDMRGEVTPPSSHVVHDGDWMREHGVRAASARDLAPPATVSAPVHPAMA